MRRREGCGVMSLWRSAVAVAHRLVKRSDPILGRRGMGGGVPEHVCGDEVEGSVKERR